MQRSSQSIILNLRVKLPNNTFTIIRPEVFPISTTVRDIVIELLNSSSGHNVGLCYSVDEVRLFYQGILMEHKDLISTFPIRSDDQIELVIVFGEEQSGRSKSVEYDDFLLSCYPEHQGIDIPVESVIKARFGPHKSRIKLSLFTPSLADYNSLPGCYLGDMVKALGGLKEAQRRGFVSWTNNTYPQRMYLLELENQSDGFSFADYRDLERIRYSVRGDLNMGYDRGDFHSWQRYTKKPPIGCDLFITDAIIEDEDDGKMSGDDTTDSIGDGDGEVDPAVLLQLSSFLPFPLHGIVTLRPYHALNYNTYYAILFQNNVPVVPLAGATADFTHFNSPSTTEDKLIVFKTVSR